MMKPGEILLSLADAVFPRFCHVCGANLGGADRYLCHACLSRLPRTHYHRRADNPMETRFMGRFPYRHAAGHFFYTRDSHIAGLIHDFKYRRFRGLARFLGTVMAEELLSTGFLSDIDVIVPVPMHPFKQARRGYNQAAELAYGVSQVSGIPVVGALRAVRDHKSQTTRSLEERIRNINGIFRVSRPGMLENKQVLIIDDVCTTGATLSAAAFQMLSEVPSVTISLLTLAVTF